MVLALAISLIILFLHACSWKGMIFERIKKIIPPEKYYIFGKDISKPIYGCPICMTPWWGTLIYWLFFAISIPHWILTILTASGLSVLYVVMIDLKDAAITYKKKEEEDA